MLVWVIFLWEYIYILPAFSLLFHRENPSFAPGSDGLPWQRVFIFPAPLQLRMAYFSASCWVWAEESCASRIAALFLRTKEAHSAAPHRLTSPGQRTAPKNKPHLTPKLTPVTNPQGHLAWSAPFSREDHPGDHLNSMETCKAHPRAPATTSIPLPLPTPHKKKDSDQEAWKTLFSLGNQWLQKYFTYNTQAGTSNRILICPLKGSIWRQLFPLTNITQSKITRHHIANTITSNEPDCTCRWTHAHWLWLLLAHKVNICMNH